MRSLSKLLSCKTTKDWTSEEYCLVREYLDGEGRYLEESHEWCMLVGMLIFGEKNIPLSSKEAGWG
jgi:hypothetical protein